MADHIYATTHDSNELALIVINDSLGYKYRCEAARITKPNLQHIKARAFVGFAAEGAARYAREFRDEPPFTAHDTLLAALELLDYYDRHVKEGV